ncbi:hypothetical protein [Viridibacillus arvi]|uniref:hypothetical protein n=1 Tax=Viridibacillus arvi TaxID=263475 RepID=UPI0034CF8FAD
MTSNQRLKILEESLLQQGIFINKLFPSKQFIVLEQLIKVINRNKGIIQINTEELIQLIQSKKGISISIRTVRSTISAIKSTHQFIVTKTNNNREYLIVDKEHEDFMKIMNVVFHSSDICR